jgi:rod shape-determining protein MreC
MQNLINFISKQRAIILFLGLQLLSFVLISRQNKFHQSIAFNATNQVAGSILSAKSDVLEYFKLLEENRLLVEENAKLRAQLLEESFIKADSLDSVWTIPNIEYIPAVVIDNSVNLMHNLILINAGSNQGIREDMGIITSNGVVGIVKSVSNKYSLAMSILNRDTKITAELKTTRHFGTLEWNGKSEHYAQLLHIPNHAELNIGDTVVTSGFSSIFPPNILIGEVTSYKIDPGDGYYSAEVKLSTDFRSLRYVYIVNDIDKAEKERLREQ